MVAVQQSEQLIDLHFPLAGTDVSMPAERQPNRPVGEGKYSRTTPLGRNVRANEPLQFRARGGQRAGLSKYIATPVVAGWLLQELNLIVRMSETPVQTSQSGRVVTVVAVNQGRVFFANAGDTAWTQATNNTGLTPPLNFTGVMQSAVNNQLLCFADGTNWAYFKPSDGTVNTWSATSGTLPVDSDGNKPRLICTWRGRTVLSGLLLDPQNWFMSKVSDPTDFNYAPLSPSATQAVAGNNSPLGLVGDVVTGLIPYNDDVLIMLGDHTIWRFQGDPMAGGQIDLVTDAIGGAWGQAWAKDPYGAIYFVSNRTGVYRLVPGQQPQRISQQIEQLLLAIDTGASTIRCLWDDRFQGLHVFVSTTAAPAADTHFFYEQRTNAWWTDTFANNNHNPLCCVTFDGNLPADRVPLIGSWDGFVRAVSPTAVDDDGYPIQSAVIIGPLTTPNLDELLGKDMQSVMALDSGDVTFSVYVGATAELALAASPVLTGTWKANRNLTNLIRRSGHAFYVRIDGLRPWAIESVRLRLAPTGKVRRRGR